MAITGQKQMSAEAKLLNLTYGADAHYTPTPAVSEEGFGNWEYTKLHEYHYFTQIRKIPLEGIYSEKLGLQLEAVSLQKPYNPVVSFDLFPAVPSPGRVNLEYFVSTTPPWVNPQERLTVLQTDGLGSPMTFNVQSSPVSMGGLSWEQTQVASNTTFTSNSNVGLSSRGWMSVLNSQLFGSNTAIANRVLYVTFIWVIEDPATLLPSAPPTTGLVAFPALRLVLAGTVFKTKKKGWLDILTRNAKIAPRQG